MRSILKTFKIIIVFTIILIIFLSSKSTNNKDIVDTNKFINPYDECSRFITGKELNKNSSLVEFTESEFYKSYSDDLNRGWAKFQKPNQEKIKNWWVRFAPDKYNKTVLYPFSGPDIMNAITFFQNADSYILFGLENPGRIMRPRDMNEKDLKKALTDIKTSLTTILNLNFFKTIKMEKDLGTDSFCGISTLLTLFLSLNGCEIIDINRIVINPLGTISPGKEDDIKIEWNNPPISRVPGIEISFRRDSGKVQTVRYFMLNVVDQALESWSPNFVPFLKSSGPFTTIIKSASYLMHHDKEKFTIIRAAILENSNYIVQDDSGIPLRFLRDEKWELGFHGVYRSPISLFSNRLQLDLRQAVQEHSSGILPFSYGYDYKEGESNLMTAKKR